MEFPEQTLIGREIGWRRHYLLRTTNVYGRLYHDHQPIPGLTRVRWLYKIINNNSIYLILNGDELELWQDLESSQRSRITHSSNGAIFASINNIRSIKLYEVSTNSHKFGVTKKDGSLMMIILSLCEIYYDSIGKWKFYPRYWSIVPCHQIYHESIKRYLQLDREGQLTISRTETIKEEWEQLLLGVLDYRLDDNYLPILFYW